MALLFVDSMAHYNDSQANRKYTTAAVPGTIIAGVAGGKMRQGGNESWTIRQGPQATLAIGTRFNHNVSGNFPNTVFSVGATGSGDLWNILMFSDGRIAAFNQGTGSATSALSTWSAPQNTLYFLELHATITEVFNPGTGRFDANFAYAVYLNGNHASTILSGTLAPGLGRVASGNQIPSYLSFGGATAWGDPYVTDGELLGDVVWYYTPRCFDGTNLQWTPKTAGAHYLMVTELVPDDDTTYLQDSTTGDKDSGRLCTITVAGAIKGIQGVWDAETQSGSGLIQGGYISGGAVEIITTPTFAPGASNYSPYLLDPQRKSVFTAADWTVSEINAMQIEIKNVS